jgi:hypothetical protein
MGSVGELKKQNRIVGEPPLLEDLVDPEDEQEVGESPYEFKGGDDEIVDEVRHEMAVERGEIIEVDSDSEGEEDNDPEPQFTKAEVI